MELNPSTTAVVAVHMQGDIVTSTGAFGGFFAAQVDERDVIAQVGALLSAARAGGATAAYTRVVYAPDYSNLNANSPLLAMVAQFGCLAEGQPNAEIVDALAPQEGDIVVEGKRGLDAFATTNLDFILRARGITTIALGGFLTNCCVESTMRTAYEKGYDVITLTDCTAATSSEEQRAAVSQDYPMFSQPMTSEQVVGALQGAGAVGDASRRY